MAKVRNVSNDILELRLSGGDWRANAAPDEVVEVPDDLFKAHAWPEDLWTVVGSGKSKSEEK